MNKQTLPVSAAAVWFVLSASLAQAGSHLWVINEAFSNSDSTVQFIELHVPCGVPGCYFDPPQFNGCECETFLSGKWVYSLGTGGQVNFNQNLPANSTALAHLLLGTQAFADLPGAPTPDYIIPANFIDTNADTLQYYTYGSGDLSFASGQLPLDGITSLNRDQTTGVNSPTNFAGQTGSVNATGVPVPATSSWGLIVMAVLVVAVAAVAGGRKGRALAAASGT